MQWDSWSAFWQMGGAAPFVWGSYGLTVFMVVAELIMVGRRRRETVRRLLRLRRAHVTGSGRRAFEEIVE